MNYSCTSIEQKYNRNELYFVDNPFEAKAVLKVLHKCVDGIMNKMVLTEDDQEDDQEKYNNHTQFKNIDRKPLNLLEDVSSIQKIIELACPLYS